MFSKFCKNALILSNNTNFSSNSIYCPLHIRTLSESSGIQAGDLWWCCVTVVLSCTAMATGNVCIESTVVRTCVKCVVSYFSQARVSPARVVKEEGQRGDEGKRVAMPNLCTAVCFGLYFH